jgi:N utilization substance protein A
VVRVDCVAEEKTAYVVVPDRYLSLAIGKEGQNARLAAKLTGWRIDIRSESEVAAELTPEPEPVPVEVEAPPPAMEEEDIRHDLVVEAEAESALADETELEDEDRALLGGKKRRDRR